MSVFSCKSSTIPGLAAAVEGFKVSAHAGAAEASHRRARRRLPEAGAEVIFSHHRRNNGLVPTVCHPSCAFVCVEWVAALTAWDEDPAQGEEDEKEAGQCAVCGATKHPFAWTLPARTFRFVIFYSQTT